MKMNFTHPVDHTINIRICYSVIKSLSNALLDAGISGHILSIIPFFRSLDTPMSDFVSYDSLSLIILIVFCF